MIGLFHKTCRQCSKITAENYSTSFSSAIRLLDKNIRGDIYAVYGFVRFADEIVDSFHDFNKEELLSEYQSAVYKALNKKISINPILQSFQFTINKYQIPVYLVDAFFKSMFSDLNSNHYDEKLYKEYIYGSAETVGLMCLYIFCNGDELLFKKLEYPARKLGAAFQKVNFLRDLKSDHENLNRIYFPNCNFKNFSSEDKKQIEEDIQNDFDEAYKGISQLPQTARLGVYVAYKYYLSLFKKIKRLPPKNVMEKRVSIPGIGKIFILAGAGLRHRLKIL